MGLFLFSRWKFYTFAVDKLNYLFFIIKVICLVTKNLYSL